MNTDLHNEEYPRLTPPNVTYANKASLKKKPVVVPLYAKIMAAAAAVALLFGLFWNRSVRHEQELMAELKPVEAVRIETESLLHLTGQRAHFSLPSTPVRKTPTSPMKPVSSAPSETQRRVELPMLTSMPPCAPTLLPSGVMTSFVYPSDIQLLASDEPSYEDTDELSWAREGFQKMTDGRFASFGELLVYGWRSVKGELAQLNESVSDGISSLKQNNKSF